MNLMLGDCLIESDKIESGSVDLILTDLPYGTIKGLGGNLEKYKHLSNSNWDNVIDTNKIMEIANRILRKNGKMVLFAQQPFTTELIRKAIPNLPHCYNLYWDKMHFANCLIANKAPVSYIEDILVFSKTHDNQRLHPLIPYFQSELKLSGLNQSEINEILRNKMGGHYFTSGSQFCTPTDKNYQKLQETGFFKKSYLDLKEINNKFNLRFSSTFNLWQGGKFKSNIFKYKKDYNGHHPTQKPVLLLEDLIKTYSNEGNLIADLTMGSGSTGVACVNTGREFIGIEMDESYFNIAKNRIEEAQTNTTKEAQNDI